MKDLKDKVVWITGASSGIGRALTLEAARLGAKVVLSGRNLAALKKVQSEAKLNAANSLVLPLDLEKYKDAAKAVPKVIKAFGAVDVLVNNGGVSQRSLTYETKLAVYEKLIAVNYLGNIALSLAVLPIMRARGKGVIVTVSSVAGIFGTPLRSGYSASKFATVGFYEAFRAENFDKNIQTTIIYPGFVNTNVAINALTSEGKKQGTQDAATAKGISPEECAERAWKGILAGKNTVYIAGGKERFGMTVHKFFPNLFAKMIRKMKVT
ncbi:MAG: putative oxidoreductase SadH [Turneriella sp.]|nr:putative oxidoreductase SadH [Turneriella sp.]